MLAFNILSPDDCVSNKMTQLHKITQLHIAFELFKERR